MATHVAILLKKYITLILSGKKTIESRLTRMNRPPFEKVAPGDRIYFKASSGPFMATAIAGDVHCFDDVTPQHLRELYLRYNHAVCGDDEYWKLKKESRFATFIHLQDIEPIDAGPPFEPSRGPAWFVFDDDADPLIETPLTVGAIRNRCIRIQPQDVARFPADAFGSIQQAGKPIKLHLPHGEQVESDFVNGRQLRFRRWGSCFNQMRVQPGDRVRFFRLNKREYRVTIQRQRTAPPLTDFISRTECESLIAQAKREDMSAYPCDLTSELLVPRNKQSTAVIRSRAAGRLCGSSLLPMIRDAYDRSLQLDILRGDGCVLQIGDVIAEARGSLQSILAFERVSLNFLTHLSGIATLTSRYVRLVAGTSAKIYDTRKTIPGLRQLAKYAVVCGGGESHRLGLYDAILVKDNHIAHIELAELPKAVEQMIARAHQHRQPPGFIEMEVDNLQQLEAILSCGLDMILLDNMSFDELRQAVALRNRIAPGVLLEASGGVNLDTVQAIAQTGVDRIAIGALTHSAPALDLGMDID